MPVKIASILRSGLRGRARWKGPSLPPATVAPNRCRDRTVGQNEGSLYVVGHVLTCERDRLTRMLRPRVHDPVDQLELGEISCAGLGGNKRQQGSPRGAPAPDRGEHELADERPGDHGASLLVPKPPGTGHWPARNHTAALMARLRSVYKAPHSSARERTAASGTVKNRINRAGSVTAGAGALWNASRAFARVILSRQATVAAPHL
jgi:hypothetical protein